MILTLPRPPAGLSPNSRNHWSKTAKALHLTLTFVPPTRRAYDLDNAL